MFITGYVIAIFSSEDVPLRLHILVCIDDVNLIFNILPFHLTKCKHVII